MKKKIESLKKKSEIYSKLEDKTISDIFWRGRPDLLILKIDKKDNSIVEIEIGEVKYTNSKSYMYKGLEELLEYMYFIKDKNIEYIEDISISGVLFVDNIELSECVFDNLKIINRESFPCCK